ncbi:uncharacterized protein FPRN_07771 [Fusarium proliferatum]|nr:uncharacterized protein FPRN_07771 [Fusarium proliferatum]
MELGQAGLSEPSPTTQQQGVENDWRKKQKDHGNDSQLESLRGSEPPAGRCGRGIGFFTFRPYAT